MEDLCSIGASQRLCIVSSVFDSRGSCWDTHHSGLCGLRKHCLSAAYVLTVKHREFLLVPYCPDYPDTPWSSLSSHICLSWKYWLEASCSLLLLLGPEISCCFFSVLVQRNNFLIMCAPLKNIMKYCNRLKLYQVKLCYMHHPAEDIQTL